MKLKELLPLIDQQYPLAISYSNSFAVDGWETDEADNWDELRKAEGEKEVTLITKYKDYICIELEKMS